MNKTLSTVLTVFLIIALCVVGTGVLGLGLIAAYDHGVRVQSPVVVATVESSSPTIETNPSAPQAPANPQPAQPAGSCPQARDLGPWAPTASGEGITFEVTASDQGASNLSSNGVVLGLWWPAGNTSWGKQEITTFVPRGMSITVVAGAGRGWDYEATCPSAEINRQMEEHMSARKNDTSYHGFVALEDLISAGLVEVRFDRSQNPTP